jgi:phosphoglycolate phosphatase
MKKVKFGSRIFEPELIIFDKDGTLTDFRKAWVPILDKRIELIHEQLGDKLRNKSVKTLKNEIYEIFGILDDRIDAHGPFPYSPPWEDEVIISTVLYRAGISWREAKQVTHVAIEQTEAIIDRADLTVLYPGARETLRDLRKNGILLSLATADLTEIARKILNTLNILDLFNYIVGADFVKNDKPDPEMIYKTAKALDVDLCKIVIVGDSIVDMEMGRRAGIGFVVGVLEGGIATREDLKKDADVVIDSVRDIKVV